MNDRVLPYLLCVCALAPVRGEEPGLTDEQREIFALLDRFDDHDGSKQPFVLVATGGWVQHADSEPEGQRRHGFLVGTGEDGAFEIRHLDLSRETYTPTPAGTPEHERVGHDPADLASYAADMIALMLRPADERGWDYHQPGNRIALSGDVLLLARCCAQAGLLEDCHALWATLDGQQRREDIAGGLDDVARGLDSRMIYSFTDPDLTWADLHAEHKQWLDAFPDTFSRRYVEGRAAMVERMAAQAAAHTGAEIPESEASVGELIFRLRDLFHPEEEMFMDGHYLETRARPLEEGRGPVTELIRRGMDAVEELIAAVDDEHLTRTVWYHSRYGGAFRTTTVGSRVRDILSEITGLHFYGDGAEARASWEEWWATAKDDPAAGLVALVRKGNHESLPPAARVLEAGTEHLGAVIEGAQNATNRYVREQFVGMLLEVEHDEAVEFLARELAEGPYVDTRIRIAEHLLDQGDRRGLQVFVDEAGPEALPQEREDPGVPEGVRDFDFAIARDGASQGILRLFLTSGELPVVRMVTRGVLRRPPAGRARVMAAIDDLAFANLATFTRRATESDRGAIEDELEHLLAQLLRDPQPARSMSSKSFSHRGRQISLNDARLADDAAVVLSEWWPGRYDFDATLPARLRDRGILRLYNLWAIEHGEATVEVPAAPDPASDDPRIAPALAKVHAADPDEQAACGAELALLEELRNRVREILIDVAGGQTPPRVLELAGAMQGEALDAEALIDLGRAAYQAFPDERKSMMLSADRLGDGLGVTVRLRLGVGAAAKDTHRFGEGFLSVSTAGEHRHSSGGSLQDLEEEARSMDRALAAGWRERVEIILRVSEDD